MNRFKTLILAATTAVSLFVGFAAAPAHAGGSTSAAPGGLIATTNDFGYWLTYYARNRYAAPKTLLPPAVVNAHLEADMAQSLLARSVYHNSGILSGLMHVQNPPDGYRFRVVSNDGERATEVMRLLFGTIQHTPVVHLDWAFTRTGWKLTNVVFLRMS